MLNRDARFLHERDRIDYSLLLGIQPIASAATPPLHVSKQWPSFESNGVKSIGEAGEEVLYMGIIDILQPYTAKKKMEGMLKRGQFRAKNLKKSIKPGNARKSEARDS